MYQPLVLAILSSVLVSEAVEVGKPAATSDGDQKGVNNGRGYSKQYGYNKVVVTTYMMPKQLVPSASYSTYIIHPVGMSPCGYSSDNEAAASVQKVEIKTENVPEKDNGYGVEDHTMDRRVIAAYAMNAQRMDDNAMEGQVMEGKAMQGYVVEGHSMNGYVIDGYEEGDVTGDESRQIEPQFSEKFENILSNNREVEDKGWYMKEEPDKDDYWEQFKKRFDTYYDDHYQRLFGDQHPFESNSWGSQVDLFGDQHPFESKTWGSQVEFVPKLSYEDTDAKRFADFQPKMVYLDDDFKPKIDFMRDFEGGFSNRVVDITPKASFMHGYEVFDKGFGDDLLGTKNGHRISYGDFDFGYGLRNKYEPKWR